TAQVFAVWVRHGHEDVFDRRQRRENADILEAATHPVSNSVERPHARQQHAVDIDLASPGGKHTADDIDDRSLARTIGTNAGGHLTGRSLNRNVLEHGDTAEIHGKPIDVKTAIP